MIIEKGLYNSNGCSCNGMIPCRGAGCAGSVTIPAYEYNLMQTQLRKMSDRIDRMRAMQRPTVRQVLEQVVNK